MQYPIDFSFKLWYHDNGNFADLTNVKNIGFYTQNERFDSQGNYHIEIYPYDKDVMTCQYIKKLNCPIEINQTGRIIFEG